MSTCVRNSCYTRAGEWPIRRYTPPLKRAPRPGVYIEQTSTETFDLARIYTRIHDPRGGISSSELHLHIEGVPTVHHGQSRVSRAVGVLCRWLCWSVLRLNWCCPSFLHFKEPGLASALQDFETKYFELIKMHRDNVAEIKIQRASGRRVFVLLLRELRFALKTIRGIAGTHNQQLTKREILHVAYYCLFFGVGTNSSRMLKMSLSTFNAAFIDAVEAELDKGKMNKEIRSNLGYVPFEGHQSHLGHYYRHLYQMIRYVDEQAINIDKYEYAKTIRAQLSTHEQALLLVNSLTPIGRNWWTKNLIVNYRLVQNIPREFFDSSTELDTSEEFKPGYFEWEETLSSTAVV